MKLPSLQYLAGEARTSLGRFPLMMTAAVVAAVCGIVATEAADETAFVRVMLTAQLGIPLFFVLAAAVETNRWPRLARVILNVVAAVALVAYHSTLPDYIDDGVITRFLQFNVALHLLVAFLPFVRGCHNGFWQYNRALFLRLLTALLYSGVVYLGLALALLALDKLLGLPIPDKAYLWLLIVTLFVFNTWVFLGGVPRDIAGLESVTDYPRALKVFAQYILMPLVVVYLAILTTYLFQVITTAVWPSGWIGWMVSSVAVVGILTLLLVWPVANRAENRWVATYTRWFFIFMIPAIVMLFLAVHRRIDQYGVTENRYFLSVLSVWLGVVAAYFILSRARRIKMIPLTLCVVAFATSFGPWGAYTVSRRSQTARLERLMEANGMLVDGALVTTPDGMSLEDRREISAISLYLVINHGQKTFDRWLGAGSVALSDSAATHGDERGVARAIVLAMGLEFVESWATTPGSEGHFNYAIDRGMQVFELDGADYMVRLVSMQDTCRVGDTGLVVAWEESAGVVLRDSTGVVALAPVYSVFEKIGRKQIWNERGIPADVMRVAVENERARFVVYFNLLGGVIADRTQTINHVNADCFVGLK